MAGKDGSPDDGLAAIAWQFSEQVPHGQDLRIQVVAMVSDQVRMRLAPQPWLLADEDAEEICGSVLYSLADSAAGLAVLAATGDLPPCAKLG